jgi:Tol biopolymer transport system component/DNA-binding winged helix-turn-helix (wHTH) protein
MGQPATAQQVRFGPFELDLRSGELTKSGHRQILPEQPLALLKALVERPGAVVTRDELRVKLWPADTFVDFEHGLNAAAKRLRDTLGDAAETPRYIETVPRRGYRFIAPVASSGHLDAGVSPRSEPVLDAVQQIERASPQRRRTATVALSMLFAAVLVGTGWLVSRHFATRRTADTVHSVERQRTRLTSGPGLQTEVAWSPDGQSIAYTSDKTGNFDIWVQQVSGGDTVQVTRSPAPDTEPDWSPDGRSLVFHRSGKDGGLFTVPALGGPEQRLTWFGSSPKWSPDGSQVLFASAEIGANQANPGLLLVGLDGQPPRRVLTTVLDGSFVLFSFAWHPDGRRISILGLPPKTKLQEWDLFTFPLTGGPPVMSKIREAKGLPDHNFSMGNFKWQQSAAALYAEIAHFDSQELWKITIDPGRLEALAAERLTAGAGNDISPAITSDGKRLAFTTALESNRLWSFPLDERHFRVGGPGEPVTPAGMVVLVSDLASDGRTLAYMPEVPKGQVWITDLVTGAHRMLGVRLDGGIRSRHGGRDHAV